MMKARLQAAALGGSADEAEAVFYDALQHGDLDRLMACWADEDEIVCIHPGGPRLVGPSMIRASFEAMFAQGAVRAWPERVHKVESLASAVHSVVERIEVMTENGLREAFVTATNVYHKTAQGWRLVMHHASPGISSEMQELAAAPQTLH